MLHINDLSYRLGDRLLFDKATVALPAGTKAGLVGRNGTGKTTLLRFITGSQSPDDGSVTVKPGAHIGQVAQEAPGGPTSLLDFVLDADSERTSLLAEAETATDPHRIAEVHTRLGDIDAYAAPSRAATILSGLGFPHADQGRPCSDFSGGWRMRVALAAVLFAEPDLLLLDEPSNYLDLEGVMWLETYLQRYPHTVLIVSHDRDLLNTSVDTIVHLDQGKLSAYRGGYDSFDRQRREQQALNLKLKRKQDDQRRHMQAFVDRFRAKATKARQAQSRLKMLEKLEPIPGMVEDEVRPFQLPNPEKQLSPPIIAANEAVVGYDEKAILRALNFNVDPDDRIGLLGANGNGKTTLAKLLSGRLQVMDGRLKRSHKMDVAYFAQHQIDELEPAQSAFDHVRVLMPDATEAQVRARTAQLGFGPEKADTPAEALSGGEKARLQLGLATFTGPHLLILDEPTNHLDVDSRAALIDALNTFEGAVIIISHDRTLLESTVDRLWLVSDGSVKGFDGDLNDYKRWLLDRERGGKSPKQAANATPQDDRKSAAKKREELAPLKKEIVRLEALMADIEGKIEKIDERLADGSIYVEKPDRAVEYAKKKNDAQKVLEQAEERWMALSEEYEQAVAAA
ncbi:MAG: ABC-F family ATP-binding cassette domain-containing protein [Pseudomonadota bacterium]